MIVKASDVIKQAKAWVGLNMKDGSAKKIIDVYNTQKPLPRGYKVGYTDNWCATFITALFIQLNAKEMIHPECGCQKMIDGMNTKGLWIEDESITPRVGDLVFYDWQDNGIGDNKGWADHVGIVSEVNGNSFMVIEGNSNNAVRVSTIKVNQKYLRGFARPKYAEEVKQEVKPVVKDDKYTMECLKKGSNNNDVTVFEILMKKLGYYNSTIDKAYGTNCVEACKKFQKAYGLTVDGECGNQTWNKLFGLKK